MQATEYLNPADPMPTEVISDMDTPHRLSLSGIYELPWGKTGSGLAQRVLGGWQLNANYQIQSGRPVGGAGAGTSFGNLLFTGNFKDILLTGDQRTPDRWFNTDAGFNKVAGQQLDRNVRTFPLRFSFLRVDRVNNVDFSLLKNTKIVEGKELQFRAEFLNALNNANYGVPDMNATSGNFGRIVGTFNYSRRIQLGLKFIF
jgi:hypothetical protein